MTSTADRRKPPHFAVLPAAGMGHLSPSLRLAVALSSLGCEVSLITAAHPTVSSAESLHLSRLLSSHPQIHSLLLPLAPFDPSPFPSHSDPFFLRFESLRRSAHLLPPLLSHNLSALVVDVTLSSAFVPIARQLNLPSYILFTSSAAMLSLFASFPTITNAVISDGIEIPGLRHVPQASVPPALLDPSHLFTVQFTKNSQILHEADGIIINTFPALEPGELLIPGLPRVISVGPLRALSQRPNSRNHPCFSWLDMQPPKSVVYVSFGSRTAMTEKQIEELGVGLEKSGCPFLWMLKTKVVDWEEEAVGERVVVKGRGLVVNGWVEQEEVLGHGAVGGFVSHCGWNSVSEAAVKGVKVLGWPRGGDQRVNGEVVRRSGLGVWMEEWRWEAEEGVVSGEEIGKKVREFMEDDGLRRAAERVKEAAVGVGGSSWKALKEFIGKFEA